MKKLAAVFLAVLLGGCAGGGQSFEADSGTGGVETEARKRAKIYTDLSAAYFARRQLKVALDEARRAITADSGYGPAYNVLALIYMDLGEDGLADENFRKSIDLGRSDSEAYNNYGTFLCTKARFDEGLDQLNQALRNPLYATPEKAMTNAGFCNEKKGDLAQADAYYTRALKLQPDYSPAILRRAELQFRQNNLTESRQLLARYQALARPSAESLWMGARLEHKLGDKTQEAAYQQQLRKLFPESPEAQLLAKGQYE